MAEAGWTTVKGRGRKSGKGAGNPQASDPKNLDEVLKQHQVRNCPKFLQSLISLGFKIPKQTPPKGKGKGKGKENNNGKNNSSPPKQEQQPTNKKGKAKGKGNALNNKGVGDKQSSQSSSAGSSGLKRPITVKGTSGTVATMYDPGGNLRVIQFICHNPECHLCHYSQRNQCMACGSKRDTGLEPTTYDPKIHKAIEAQRQINTMYQASPAAMPPGQPPQVATAPLFPADWADQDPLEEAAQDQDMLEEDANAATDAAATPQTEQQEDLDVMKQWHPACLTKANIRLCIHEGSQEVLRYKSHFDINDLAESELTKEIEHLRQRLTTMQITPALFILDIAHAQQRIGQLEHMRAKEDASVHTSGEHHTTGGRLQIVLGNHISNMAKEDADHTATIVDLESQVAALQATMAREERLHALRSAANEAFRAEIQAKVSAYTGPQQLLQSLQTEKATTKMQELTDAAFSPDWIQDHSLSAIATPEVLKILVTQAMSVALKAQSLGIQITPPQPSQQVTAPGLELQPQASHQLLEPSGDAAAPMQPAVSFGPSPLENLPAGGFAATRANTPYMR